MLIDAIKIKIYVRKKTVMIGANNIISAPLFIFSFQHNSRAPWSHLHFKEIIPKDMLQPLVNINVHSEFIF